MPCSHNDRHKVEVEGGRVVRHVGRDGTDVDETLGISTEEDEGKHTCEGRQSNTSSDTQMDAIKRCIVIRTRIQLAYRYSSNKPGFIIKFNSAKRFKTQLQDALPTYTMNTLTFLSNLQIITIQIIHMSDH